MMKKMILAAVAAVTLAGATQSASAGSHGYGGYGGHGWGGGHNWGGGYQNNYYGYKQHCAWQRIKVRDHYGNWIWKRVKVCH
jgi:hypothetical protein